MSADTITQLYVRMKMSGVQHTQINPFAINRPGKFPLMGKQQERCLVGDVSTGIPPGGVVPFAIEQMKDTTNVIVPPHRQIAPAEIGKVNEIDRMLIGKSSTANPPEQTVQRSQPDALLYIRLNTLVGAIAPKDSLDATLVIYREGGIAGIKRNFPTAIHVEILSGSPAQPETWCKTGVGGTKLYDFARQCVGCRQFRGAYSLAPMHGKTGREK